MNFKRFLKKERQIWHRHFVPSLVAALAAGLIAYIFEATTSNIILFASLGASAFILSNAEKHRLTKLKITVKAYTIAVILSVLLYYIDKIIPMHMCIKISILVFIVSMGLYLANAVHPPAVSASLSFILLERGLGELFMLLLAIILLLTMMRAFTYVYSKDLSIRHFLHEFKKD